jgi:O-antigen/teichoic acid export membrane protein
VPESLSKRVVKGGLWVLALRLINRGLGFVRTIILARLLAPEDFGLLGIAMLAVATLETFSQTGFQPALIHKKGNIESYLDTAWTVSAIRGTILFGTLFFAAPTIARFFNSPLASLVIRVIAISTLLAGFRNIGIVFFQKELEFNKQFSYEFSATVIDLTLAISLAFILRNVWALVWGGLAANLTRLIMSYVVHPYRPNMQFSKKEFRELFSFGKWVLSSSILIFLLTQGDDIFVGKLLGVTALGLYQIAYLISNLPATEITHVISQVTFPTYSSIQHDLPRLREAYFRVLEFTAVISIPLAGAIFILAPEFTAVFLGQKWTPMVHAMQILCIFGVSRSIAATMGPILYAVGKPEIQTKLSSIHLILMAIVIYPLTTKWGILGTSLAVVIPNIIVLILIIRETKNILKSQYKDFLMHTFVPVISTFVMLSILFLKQNLSLFTNDIVNFIILALCCFIIYITSIYISEKARRFKFWNETKTIINDLSSS